MLTGTTYVITNEINNEVTTITVDMTASEVIADLDGLAFDANYQPANDIVVISEAANTGNMTVNGTTLINQITTGTGNDTIVGGAAADVLVGNAGVDNITGNAGNDVIDADAGNDIISGGAGADIMRADAGDDNITAGEGADNLAGQAGGDTIDISETTAAADVVTITALTDGAAAVGTGNNFTGFDVITGFATTSDKLVFDSGVTNANMGNATVDGDIVDGTLQVKAGTAATLAGNDLTLSNYTSIDAVINFIQDGGTAYTASGGGGANDDILAVTLGTGATALTAVYHVVDDAAAATVDPTEIVLIATVDATLVAGDIVV